LRLSFYSNFSSDYYATYDFISLIASSKNNDHVEGKNAITRISERKTSYNQSIKCKIQPKHRKKGLVKE